MLCFIVDIPLLSYRIMRDKRENSTTLIDLFVSARAVGNSSYTKGTHLHTQQPPEHQSKKYHDRLSLATTKKDRGKMIAMGIFSKRSKHLESTPIIHLPESIGNPPPPLAPVLVGRTLRTMAEIKDCVSVEDYAQLRKLSKTRKSGLLAE